MEPFAPQLEALDVSFRAFTPPPPPPLLSLNPRLPATSAPIVCPHLKFLSVSGKDDVDLPYYVALVPELRRFDFRTVKSLRLFGTWSNLFPTSQTFRSMFPNIRQLEIDFRTIVQSERFTPYPRVCAIFSKAISDKYPREEVTVSPIYSPFLPVDTSILSPCQRRVELSLEEVYLWEGLKEVLEFSLAKVEGLRLAGDVEGAKKRWRFSRGWIDGGY